MADAGAIRAGAAFVELTARDEKLIKSLKAIQGRLKSFGAGVESLGKNLFLGGSTVVAGLLGAAQQFASMGDVFTKMSDRTGASVEALSELAYAAEQSGASVETLEKGMRKAQQNITDAANGSKTAQAALAAIGLSAKDLANLSPDEQFKLIAEGIARISDPAQRTTAAIDLLGRSGAELLPMMRGGAKGIEELQAQARDLGLTMRGEDAQAATVLGDTMDDLWKVVRMGVFTIGSALAPLLIGLVKKITGVAVAVKAWLTANKPLIVSVLKISALIAATGAVFIAAGIAIAGMGAVAGGLAFILAGVATAIGVIGSVLGALLSPIGLVLAGLATLGAYFFAFTESGGQAVDWLLGKFNGLKTGALKVFAGIANALAAGNLSLAADVLWKSLKVAWESGCNSLTEIWTGFKRSFMEIATGMWYGAQVVLVNAWAGLQKTWIEVVSFLSATWAKFTSAIQIGWSTASDWISKKMLDLWKVWDDTFGKGDFNAELAKSFIDQQGNVNRTEIANQSQQEIAGVERDRQSRLAGVESDQNAALSQIGQADAEDRAKREADYATQLQKSQQDLQEAKKAWNDSLAQASDAAQVASADAPKAPQKPEFLSDEILARIQAPLAGAAVKGEAKGQQAYNSYGLQSLAAGSAAEQTAKNTADLLKEAKKTNRLLGKTTDAGFDVE